MRKGLTLIELIFSMVIVAITFTVIPKLVQTMADSSKVVVQEDAIFNTMTLMGLITRLPWDGNNVDNDSILTVTNGVAQFTCNPNTGPHAGYRNGGFAGGRNCIAAGAASTIPTTTPTTQNSISDYNNYSLNTQVECGNNLYDLGVTVSYVGGATSDIKHVQIRTNYNNAFKLHSTHDPCTMMDYAAFNIGQVAINRRRWQ